MSVEIIGLGSFIAGLGVAQDMARPVVEKAALNMALTVRSFAQAKVPKRSTVLAQSIQATPLAYGAQTSVEEKYGIYVEQGTGMFDPRGAHLIYPTSAQALVWEEGGQRYGARWTRGMEAQPFFWPAVDDTEPFIVEEMGRAATILIQTAVSA